MASVKFEKGSEEWQMFTDFWALCQKYWEIEDSDKYWEQSINAADDFCKKYNGKNGFFAKKLASALGDTLAKKEKERLKH